MHRIRIPIEMEADISSLPLSCLVRCARQVEAEPTVGLPMAWILSATLASSWRSWRCCGQTAHILLEMYSIHASQVPIYKIS